MRHASAHLLLIAATLVAGAVGCGQPELDGHDGLDVTLSDGGTEPVAADDGGADSSMTQEASVDVGAGDDAAVSEDVGTSHAGVASDGAAGANAAEAGATEAGTRAADAGAGSTGQDASSSPDAGGAAPTSYEAESGSLFGQATIVACAPCSNGHEVSLKADSGFQLWGVDAGGEGTRSVVIYYTNGTSGKTSLYVGVNGDDSQSLSNFPPTGGWDHVSSLTVSLSGFRAGTNNMMTFFIDTEQPAADVDRIEIVASASAALAR